MTLNDAISKAYTKEDLLALYDAYFRTWIEKGWVRIPKTSVFYAKGGNLLEFNDGRRPALLDPLKVNNINKNHFTAILLQFFTDEKTFKAIFETLPENVRELLVRVAFEHRVSIEGIERELLEPRKKKLKKSFRLLNAHVRYSDWTDETTGYLHLQPEIAKSIKSWLPKPKNYDLNPVSLAEDELMQCDFEREVVGNLHQYRDFIATQMKYSKSGSILKSSYKKLHTTLSVGEFYAKDKRIEFMRSEILAVFFDALKDELKESPGNAASLKETVFRLQRGKIGDKLSLSALFESHLKGCSSRYTLKERKSEVFQTLGMLMKLMPSSGWVGFRNMIECMYYRDLQYTLKDDYYNCYVATYFREYYEANEYSMRREEITAGNLIYLVTEPLYKGLMFLMASLGFVRLAYTSPFGSDPMFKDGALSRYDGLVAVQMTKLGQFAFGIADDYDAPESVEDETAVTLNDQRLLITLKGEDPIKRFTIEALAVKRTATLYQFDYETLYRGAKATADVKETLAALFKIAEGEIPLNWKALETDVTARLNPLKQRTAYVVLELNRDIGLLKILATDATLKKLIVKAENYMIIARKTDVPAIKQRLRKYGYFFESR